MYGFINGHITPIKEPSILATDRGFLLGDGLFETIRSENNHLLFFQQHYIRLLHSAQFLGIECPYTEPQLKEACRKVLYDNELTQSTAAIRITLTRGKSDRGINLPSHNNATLVITASTYNDNKQFYPSICLTDVVRNEYSKVIHMKTLQYMEPILCRKYAKEIGYDDGLMKNTKGAITEASVANIFFITNGKLVTPKLEDGIFPGILRQNILTICKNNNLPLEESTIMPYEIADFEYAFITNSLVEVQPVNKIASNQIEKANTSDVFDEIAKIYQDTKYNY
jgi:branched-chain amino acid aminotransferase